MKAYKGFIQNPDGTLQCRDKRYVPGETYTEKSAELCRSGMHACLAPIDVLDYYPPATSVYYEVEVGDDAQRDPDGDSKVSSTTLKVGGEIGIPGLVKAQVEYTIRRAEPSSGSHSTGDWGAASAAGLQGAAYATGDRGAASATGYRGAASATGLQGAAYATGIRGAASATGDQGAASATGYRGVASATGYRGVASATGDRGAASATGYRGAASAAGYRGAASATGDLGVASATGDRGAASATGIRGAATATGDQGAATTVGDKGAASATGEHSIAHADGYEGKAKGAVGCGLTLAERDASGTLVGIVAVIVGRTYDGVTIEPDTYYWLHDGKIEEAE